MLIKSIFTLFLTLLIYLTLIPVPVSAVVVSNCVITKVGSPGGEPVVPSSCKRKFVYYCQNDYKYCDIDFSGCGPTSMAMILSTFGIATTPEQAADLFKARGFRQCGEGSQMVSAIEALMPERGFTYKQLLSNPAVGSHNAGASRPALNLTNAKQYLNQGYLIIGSVEGHIFVVDDVNPVNNTVHLQDPAGPGCRARNDNPPGYWHDNNFPWLSYSWYYAYAVKKIK